MTEQRNTALRFPCPACGGNMKVPPGQAGQTCQCPRCQAKVTAPVLQEGAQAAKTRPLSTDDPFFDEGRQRPASGGVEVAPPPIAVPPAPPTDPSTASTADNIDESEPSRVSTPDDVPHVQEQPQPSNQGSIPLPADDEWPSDEEIGVECQLCHSRLYTTADKIGQEIRCPDCHSMVTVRAPRHRPKRRGGSGSSGDDDFRLSDPVERPPSSYITNVTLDGTPPPAAKAPTSPEAASEAATTKTEDVQAANARSYLEKAEAERKAIEDETPQLPARLFRDQLFTFLSDIQGSVRIALVSILWVVALFFLTTTYEKWDVSGPGQLILPFLVVPLTVFALAFVFFAASCCLAVLDGSANGLNAIENWPGFSISDWVFDGMYVVASSFASIVPGILAGQVLGCAGAPSITPALLGCLTFAAFFPIFLISAMESSSAIGLASPAVWKTLRSATELWKAFYLRSVGVAIGVLIAGSLSVGIAFFPMRLFFGIAMVIGLMVYFRLLGRLTWALAEMETDEE